MAELFATNWNFIGCQMPHFMIVLIPCANLLNLSLIQKKTSVFKLEMDLAKERDRGFNQG